MASFTIPFPAKPGRSRRKVDAKRILALRAAGVSWRKIGKRLGIGAGTAIRAAGGRAIIVPKIS